MRLLIVEDDSLLSSLYKDWMPRILSEYNFRAPVVIDMVTSGEEAAELLKYYTYDIVFLDMVIPGMSGVELFKRFHNSVKYIVLTSSHVDYFKEYIAEPEYPLCLQKPFDCARVGEVIREIIEEGKLDAYSTTDNQSKKYEVVR